jgi:glycosyltransferase involved in cell wall biosynthesis
VADFAEHVEIIGGNDLPALIKRVRALFYLALGIPTAVTLHKSREMSNRVATLIEYERFDAVLIYEMTSIQFCPPVAYKRAIVNIEDPQSMRLSRMMGLSVWSLMERARLFVSATLTARYEKRLLGEMGKVLVLSEADMSDMRKAGAPYNLGQVSYGVESRNPLEIVPFEHRYEDMVVFSGNMYHPPNVDAALFFLQRIFPLVLDRKPTATFWIVGAEPDARIGRASARFGDRVRITGQVNDVTAYLRRARVSVCPVRLKIGVQTKILEALSWGTPVVTTSAGNSGVGGRHGIDLWVDDDPGEFASRVVALLQGKDWARLSEDGRKLVTDRFSWKRSIAQLEQHIELLHSDR